MIGNVLCSTGAFSRDPDLTDPFKILAGIHELQCDGFELIFYPSFYNDIPSIREVFGHAQDQIHALHTEKSIGPLLGTGSDTDAELALHRLEINAELAATLQIKRLVLHLWGLPESDKNIERNLSYFEKCHEIVESKGSQLTIESIPCVNSSPLRHLRSLIDTHDPVRFTLDTEFLSMHNELHTAIHDPLLLANTEHLHIKDFGGSLVDDEGKRVYLHPGQGDIDFYEVLTQISKTPNRIDVCLESTSVDAAGSVVYAQVQRDLDFIKEIVESVPCDSV